MSNKPSFIAKVAKEREGKKPFWTTVGTVYPTKSGEGFNLSITPGISISGNVYLAPFTEKPEAAATEEFDDQIPY